MGTLGEYVSRTIRHAKMKAFSKFTLQDASLPYKLYSFHTLDNCKKWIVGSDADFGGNSNAYWGMTET
jgi:hypothetical protein